MSKKILNHYISDIQNKNRLIESANAPKKLGIMSVIGGIYSATMILRYASDMAKQYLSKAGRSCSHLSGASKNMCVIDFKIRGIEAEIRGIKYKRRGCNKAKDPVFCRNKINNKLQQLNGEINDLKKHKQIFAHRVQEEKRNNSIGN